MDKINRLLVGNYNITQPYQTNNNYEFERTDVPCTYYDLNEPKDTIECDIGGDIQISVRTIYSEEQILSLTNCDSHNKWAINLNPSSTEPLITIFINKIPFLTLMDTGAEVSAASSYLIDKIGLNHLIDTSKKRYCKGPSGEPLKILGTVPIKFKIGNEEYMEQFLIIDTLCSNLILSYPFMNKHGIRLYCGNTITNHEGYTPPAAEKICKIKEIKFLKLRPARNYEIPQNSITSLKLKIYDCPLYEIKEQMFRPFFVSLCCGKLCNNCYREGQICFLDHNFQFKYLFENKNNYNFSIETNELYFGFATPMNKYLEKSNILNKIQTRDITKELDLNECLEDPTVESIGMDGIQTADLNATDRNYKEIKLSGQGTSVESFLESNPCNACLSEGRQYFCSYTDNCEAEIFKIQLEEIVKKNKIIILHNLSCMYNASGINDCLLI